MHETGNGHRFACAAAIVALTAALFTVRMTAPPDLMDRDQERPAAYVLDAVLHGHWLIQRDWTGAVTSKPPLYTWFAAAVSLATGAVTTFALYLPSVLAVTGCALAVFFVSARWFGWAAGAAGAALFLCNYLAVRVMALARTDAVFAAAVCVAALLAFRAWSLGRGWIGFWVAAAVATLAKGPLGVLLALGGLAAIASRPRPSAPRPPRAWRRLAADHLPGILLFALLVGGWFAWSVADQGQDVVTKLIHRELLHPSYDERPPDPLWIRFWKPSGYFLGRFLPASLFTLVGLWRVFRRPAGDDGERDFERFLAAWFLIGLAVLSLATHQRGDLLAPILVPAAVLAGREADRMFRLSALRRLVVFVGVVAAMGLVLFDWHYYHVKRARYPVVQNTVRVRDWAGEIAAATAARPVIFTDTPFALQFYLRTCSRQVSMAAAAEALLTLPGTRVAVRDRPALEQEVRKRNSTATLRTVSRTPSKDEPFLQLVELASDT